MTATRSRRAVRGAEIGERRYSLDLFSRNCEIRSRRQEVNKGLDFRPLPDHTYDRMIILSVYVKVLTQKLSNLAFNLEYYLQGQRVQASKVNEYRHKTNSRLIDINTRKRAVKLAFQILATAMREKLSIFNSP